MAEIVKTEAVPETKEADPEIKEAVAAEVVEVVKVRASPEVLAILMGPQIKPARSIGNSEKELGYVPTATAVPGATTRAPGPSIIEMLPVLKSRK